MMKTPATATSAPPICTGVSLSRSQTRPNPTPKRMYISANNEAVPGSIKATASKLMLVLAATKNPIASRNQRCLFRTLNCKRPRTMANSPTWIVAMARTYMAETPGEIWGSSNRAKTKCRLSMSRSGKINTTPALAGREASTVMVSCIAHK